MSSVPPGALWLLTAGLWWWYCCYCVWDTLLSVAFVTLYRRTVRDVLKVTTKMLWIEKRQEKKETQDSVCSRGGLACVTQQLTLTEDSYSTLCSHDELAPKDKCGHTQRKRQRRRGWGGVEKEISGILLPPWKRTLWQHLPLLRKLPQPWPATFLGTSD